MAIVIRKERSPCAQAPEFGLAIPPRGSRAGISWLGVMMPHFSHLPKSGAISTISNCPFLSLDKHTPSRYIFNRYLIVSPLKSIFDILQGKEYYG
jgi:hypothetical protein